MDRVSSVSRRCSNASDLTRFKEFKFLETGLTPFAPKNCSSLSPSRTTLQCVRITSEGDVHTCLPAIHIADLSFVPRQGCSARAGISHMALCVNGSSEHEHCVFDDVQCLLICELCGAVVSRDDSVFEVAFADGMPTSTRVHDEGSTSSDQVTANTVVRR